jgi:hypothetical protein
MKWIMVVFFFAVVSLSLSCTEENGKSKIYDDSVFYLRSSDVSGFCAKKLDNVEMDEATTDFVLIQQDKLTGDLFLPFLSHPNLEKRFYPISRYNDAEIAENYFNRYVAPPDDRNLEQFASHLAANHVWMVKTNNHDYLKIWILDIHINRSGNHPIAYMRFNAVKVADQATLFTNIR